MRKDFAMARIQTAEVADDQGAATTTIRMVPTARIQMTRHEAAMKASHSTMHVGSASATRGSTQQIEVNLFQTGEIELTKVKALGCGFQQFFGRPNWGRIFFKMAEQHPKEEIGVFLCGPSAIRRDLQQGVVKAKDSSAKHGSSFMIYAENF